jgi:hypothetical protein
MQLPEDVTATEYRKNLARYHELNQCTVQAEYLP